MADKKITDLQQVSAITDDLNFPVDDTLQTYRATIAQLKDFLEPVFVPPSTQNFLSGSGTCYLTYAFIVSSASATVGATYTNNGITYTVTKTVSSANIVYLYGSGDPTSGGSLTKASGTGDTTLSFSEFKKPKYLRVMAVGGGGGGGAGGLAGNSAGNNGGDTTFGSGLLTAGRGFAGVNGGAGGAGGTNSISSDLTVLSNIFGGSGSGTQAGNVTSGNTNGPAGGCGGSSYFGGAGGGGHASSVGLAAASDSGSGGGGGGGTSNTTTVYGGSGGGSGGFVEVIIDIILSSWAFTIGAGGAGGSGTTTSGAAGANGANGKICVEFNF